MSRNTETSCKYFLGGILYVQLLGSKACHALVAPRQCNCIILTQKYRMKSDVQHAVAEVEIEVTEAMTAALDGREIHRVYSTFWLAYHAEVAARRAIEPHFEHGENAVGGELHIRHEAMAAIGDCVRVCATVTEFQGRKIVCSIQAFSQRRRIASGHQVQIVLPQTDIDRLVDDAYGRDSSHLA